MNHLTNEQLCSLKCIFDLARQHLFTGGGTAAAKLLLGLYNSRRFPFELNELRRFDLANLEAAWVVLRMFTEGSNGEVHLVLDAMQGDGTRCSALMEHWAYDLKLKGRYLKADLPDLRDLRGATCSSR